MWRGEAAVGSLRFGGWGSRSATSNELLSCIIVELLMTGLTADPLQGESRTESAADFADREVAPSGGGGSTS